MVLLNLVLEDLDVKMTRSPAIAPVEFQVQPIAFPNQRENLLMHRQPQGAFLGN